MVGKKGSFFPLMLGGRGPRIGSLFSRLPPRGGGASRIFPISALMLGAWRPRVESPLGPAFSGGCSPSLLVFLISGNLLLSVVALAATALALRAACLSLAFYLGSIFSEAASAARMEAVLELRSF